MTEGRSRNHEGYIVGKSNVMAKLLATSALTAALIGFAPSSPHAACNDPAANGDTILCDTLRNTTWSTNPGGTAFDNVTLDVSPPSGEIDTTGTGTPAILIDDGSTGTLINIFAGRDVSADTVAIDGSINADTIFNAGDINGDVLLGGGDDTFTQTNDVGASVSGMIDGGAGTGDTLILDIAESANFFFGGVNLDNVMNFETLSVIQTDPVPFLPFFTTGSATFVDVNIDGTNGGSLLLDTGAINTTNTTLINGGAFQISDANYTSTNGITGDAGSNFLSIGTVFGSSTLDVGTGANLGGGDDNFSVNGPNTSLIGMVDGGAGTLDQLTLGGSGGANQFNLDQIANFERLFISGSTDWTLTGTEVFEDTAFFNMSNGNPLNIGNGTPGVVTVNGASTMSFASTININAGSQLNLLGGLAGGSSGQTINVFGTFNTGTGALFGSGDDTVNINPGATLVGNIDGGGQALDSFNVNETGTNTYNGNFTNFGTFVLMGGGLLTLGGANQATTSNINNGTLSLIGSLASTTNVAAGSTVEGTGSTTILNNSGTVAPGVNAAVNPVGTLMVTGDYTQSAGGTFQVHLDPAGTHDILAVGGNANLDGTLSILGTGTGFTAGQTFTVLTSGGATNGVFSTVNVGGTGLNGFLVSVNYSSVTILLANSPAALLNTLSLTPNQFNTLQNISQNQTPLFDVAFALGLLPASQVPAALDQLHPELYDSQVSAIISLAHQTGEMVDNRLLQLWLSTLGGPGGQNAYGPDGTRLLADAERASGILTPNGMTPVLEPGLVSLWASALGNYGRHDADGPNLGYDYTSTGALVGADLALSENAVIGVLLGGAFTDIGFHGRSGESGAETFTTGIYGGWVGRRYFANASFVYGHNWYETERPINFGTFNRTADSEGTGYHLAGHARVGARYIANGWTLEPSGSLDYVHAHQNAFTETGAGILNLSVDKRQVESLRLGVSFRVAREIQLSETAILVPEVRVGYTRELLNDVRRIDANFAGTTAQFRVDGDRPDRDIATFGAGAQLRTTYGISVFAHYRGEVGANSHAHAGQAGVRVSW